MNHRAVLALYDQEQRIDIEFPGMRKEALPHVVRFVRPAPGMSTILYSRVDSTNADSVIREQIAYFSALNLRFTWKVYTHDTPPGLKDRLVTAGFAPDDVDAIMVLDLHAAPPSLLAPVTADVRPITRREQIDDVIVVMEQVWGGNFGWMTQRLGDHLAIPGYLSIHVAYVDDRPASAGWMYCYPNSQFAGLWGGSTVAAYRKQGLYTSLLAARVQEALRRGYRYVTTDASAMSKPIAVAHGFEVLTHAYACEWQGNQTP